MIDGEDISEMAWKWRCKIASIGKKTEKTLADFSSGDTAVDDPKAENTKPANPKIKKNAKAPAPAEKEPPGSVASVKTFYEGKDSTESYINWVDYPPRQLSKAAAKAQDRVAIKLYKVKDHDKPVISGRFALKYHMIEVQNPALVAALEVILKKQDVHLDSHEMASFKAPFRPLFFSYDDIVAKYKSLADEDSLKQFMLLFIKVLDEVFGEVRAKKRQLEAKGLVSWKIAWTYFPKDDIVLSWADNCELLCKVIDTSYKVTRLCTVLAIRAKALTFNGEAFVWEECELEIYPFDGNRPVTEMEHYPVHFSKDGEAIKARLQARGRKMLDYQGLHYCTYTGIGIYHEPKKVEKHNVDGRILIDVVGYNKHHLAQGSRENKNPEIKKNTVKGTGRDKPDIPATATNNASKTATPEKTTSVKRLTAAEQEKNKAVMLKTGPDLMFIQPVLEGYALKNKIWLKFFIEDIKPMVWNDHAYDHLVYDEQQKDLVLSFVENYGAAKPQIEDVIIGKGQGLIMLLSGPPGTGKTLMAEAVADRSHRPLFYLQAEDLGISAATLGANIKKVFEMATEWNAVILLDEADVFMAERHPQDIARNELVSIFLRELEYFRGILFLTTNLYSTIDSAFRSRVSLHLLFKPLTPEARFAVWKKFLDQLPKTEHKAKAIEGKPGTDGSTASEAGEEQKGSSGTVVDLTDEDLKELATWHLNGREIKNAVKMVKSWCDNKCYDMTLARLENGIRVTSPHVSKTTHERDDSLYDD